MSTTKKNIKKILSNIEDGLYDIERAKDDLEEIKDELCELIDKQNESKLTVDDIKDWFENPMIADYDKKVIVNSFLKFKI